jgi:hypothetical protein
MLKAWITLDNVGGLVLVIIFQSNKWILLNSIC